MAEKIKSQSSSVKSTATESSTCDKRKFWKNDAVTEASSSTTPNCSTSYYNTRRVATDTPDESLEMPELDNNQPISQDFKPATLLSAQVDARTKNHENNNDEASGVKSPKESTINQIKTPGKPKARRRSNGIPEHRSKSFHRKASKPKMTHIDAKPGDYFYVRLKGYPLWPAIVCDESMLPNTLLKTRPVTAARADGSYREDFMDGAPKAKDRSFPVMYLFTNEFSWIPNYDLLDIDFNEVANISGTMRKDLAMARQLASEKHDLNYFKDILKKFMEARENERAELEKSKDEKTSLNEKKEFSEGKKTPKKSRKQKASGLENDNVVLSDVKPIDEPGVSEEIPVNVNSKRPAEELLDGPPKKKTTIKLNTKPKIENLSAKSPKATPSKKKSKEKSEKASKVQKIKASSSPIMTAPAEPELTAEEKRVKKEKEILFLRHKLQKGLLNKDQVLKSEEMKLMSEFVEKLEAYTDLEVTIIRQTKINKVLKAILKLPHIPLEHEYRFKSRSQSLLDDWNKLLANDPGNLNTSANGTIIQVKNKADQPKSIFNDSKFRV